MRRRYLMWIRMAPSLSVLLVVPTAACSGRTDVPPSNEGSSDGLIENTEFANSGWYELLPGNIAAAWSEAWTLDGEWTGVVGDESKGAIYAVGRDGKCIDVNFAGKNRRESKLEGGGSTVRLATFRDGAKALLTFEKHIKELRAFDLNGKELWNYPDGIDDVWASDLDGDGSDEVIVGYNGNTGLHVLDGKGQLLWKSTDIVNVWHVCAGDVMGEGKVQVVTTSARGKAHVFSSDGKKRKDIEDPRCYASMVRIAKPSDKEKAATILVAGAARGVLGGPEVLTALSGDGTKRWSMKLSSGQLASDIASAYVAPGRPWLAVGMLGGHVHVVNIDTRKIIATMKDQGWRPEVGWGTDKDAGMPLLLVATGSKLNAFRAAESE